MLFMHSKRTLFTSCCIEYCKRAQDIVYYESDIIYSSMGIPYFFIRKE